VSQKKFISVLAEKILRFMRRRSRKAKAGMRSKSFIETVLKN
jgi:hypothetical protein